MPIDYSKYPSNWFTEIRPNILKRDGNKCKFCGKPNYSVGYYENNMWYPTAGNIIHDKIGQLGAKNYSIARELCDNINEYACIDDEHYIVIVLTIAHLDQDINNNTDENLAALCQRCHLKHDREFNKALKKQKQLTGQLTLQI
jgi:hypothetical protein